MQQFGEVIIKRKEFIKLDLSNIEVRAHGTEGRVSDSGAHKEYLIQIKINGSQCY